MADVVPPAPNKVELPALGNAPEAATQAPVASGDASTFKPTSAPAGPAIPGLTATAPPVSAPSDPAEAAPEKSAPPPVEEKKLEHSAGGAGPAVSAPKPVEVMSVPDTPMNGSTPAGGTPRPELDIPTEKIEIPKSNEDPAENAQKASTPAVTTGAQGPTPLPAVSAPKEDLVPEPIKDSPSGPVTNGKAAAGPTEMAGALQTKEEPTPAKPSSLKRKLEEDEPSEGVNGSSAPKPEPERAEKKAKLDETPLAPAEGSNGSTKPDESSAPDATVISEKREPEKTNGRAKRGMGKRARKIAEAVVGKTARKTRSQGPA